jgi:hypothetical protein
MKEIITKIHHKYVDAKGKTCCERYYDSKGNLIDKKLVIHL